MPMVPKPHRSISTYDALKFEERMMEDRLNSRKQFDSVQAPEYLMAAATMDKMGHFIPQNDDPDDPPARLVRPNFNVKTGQEDPSIKTEEDFLKNLPDDLEATRSKGSDMYTIRPRKKERPKPEDLVS